MDRYEEIHTLAIAQSSGQLTDAQLARLEALVLEDDEACRLYVEYVRESASLRWWAERVPRNNEREAAQRILFEAVEADLLAQRRRRLEEEVAHQQRAREAQDRSRMFDLLHGDQPTSPPVRHIVIPRVLVHVAVGALAAMVLLTVWLMMPPSPDEPPTRTNELAGSTIDVVLDETVDAQWLGIKPARGHVLPAQPLHLVSGWIQLTFPNGAVGVLEGPALFEVIENDALRLTSGRITARVPGPRTRLAVHTPRSLIVDLGTEFGVGVSSQGDAQVHVFDGKVALQPDAHNETTALILQAGDARSVQPDLSVHAIELQRAMFPYSAEAMLDRNLVVNGDFESGKTGRALSERTWESAAIVGWATDPAGATTLNYEQAAEFNYPNPKIHRVPLDRGDAYFAGMVEGTTWQEVSLAPLGRAIDAGVLRYDMTGWLGGFGTNEDAITYSAIFLDRDGTECGRVVLGPIAASERHFENGFVALAKQGIVPVGARSVRFELETHRERGTVVDGYADNLSFVVRLQGVR